VIAMRPPRLMPCLDNYQQKRFGAQNDGINETAILDTEVCTYLTFLHEHEQTLFFEGGNSTQDFDDLVRSSDTMKVSLTPDRLRTMESTFKELLSPYVPSNAFHRLRKQQQRQTTQREPENFLLTTNLEHLRLLMLTVAIPRHLTSSTMVSGSHRCHRFLMLIPSSKMRNPRKLFVSPQATQPHPARPIGRARPIGCLHLGYPTSSV